VSVPWRSGPWPGRLGLVALLGLLGGRMGLVVGLALVVYDAVRSPSPRELLGGSVVLLAAVPLAVLARGLPTRATLGPDVAAGNPVAHVLAGLLIRRIGVEGGEVGLGVEGEVGDGYLHSPVLVHLDDDVRHLPRPLVGNYLRDPADLLPVPRARLESDQTPLFHHALKTSSFLAKTSSYPAEAHVIARLDIPQKSNKI